MANKVILVGNLGGDVKLSKTPITGKEVASFIVATSERIKDKDGNCQEKVEWHSVVAWGATAAACKKYLLTGHKVYVEGRLQTRKWQDKEGHDRWTTEVIAVNVEFLGGARGIDSSQKDDMETDVPF